MCAKNMSSLRAIVVLVLITGFSECFVLHENSDKLDDAQWRCDTICEGSGGRAVLNLENKICKCTLDKQVDDIDVELMLKRAMNLGLQIVSCDKCMSRIMKRETSKSTPDDNLVGQKQSKFTIPRPKPSLNPSPLRNAQFNRRSSFTAPKKASLLPTARKSSPSRSTVDTQKRLKELQKRLNDRMQAFARNAPKLQQRAGFTEEKRENILEQIRQKHEELQEKLKATLSSVKTGAGKKTSEKHDTAVIGSQQRNKNDAVQKDEHPGGSSKKVNLSNDHSKQEIITQDPRLYMDDD